MAKSIGSVIGSTVAVAVLMISMTACSGGEPSETSAPDSAGLPLVDAGKLTVCISKNAYPPMYWNEGGTLTGFDVDSVKAIAEELDLDVVFSEMAFDGLLPALTSQRCDLLRSGLYVNDERQEKADAIPYLMTGPALIVPKGNPLGINTLDDLAGVRIAAQAASANEKQLKAISEDLVAKGFAPMDISSYPELPETVAALNNGRVDATIETDVAASQIVSTLDGKYEVLGDLFEAGTNFGMFLNKNSPLTSTVTEAAVELSKNGKFEELAKKYDLNTSRLVTP